MNGFDFTKEAFSNLWAAIGEGNWSKVLIIVFVFVSVTLGIVVYKLDARLSRIQAAHAKEVTGITKDGQAKVDSVVRLRFEDKEKALEEKQEIIDMFQNKKAITDSLVKQIGTKDSVIKANTVRNSSESKALEKDLKKVKR